MSVIVRPLSLPSFRPPYRASGLLLHVTSLPSPYGIGDVGPSALSWIDHLEQAGQRWWQALPLGPTGYGNSAYQSVSSFAGNESLISPDWLMEDEPLRASDIVIGDSLFFISPDSSDVWAHPELFLLDEQHRPRFVAGLPPDYFGATGQLWGNPIYDWDALRERGYNWYIDRLKSSLAHVNVIRLDHFRGFAAAWHVPDSAETAESGKWVPGPGADLFQAIERELHSLPFIVEDLGVT